MAQVVVRIEALPDNALDAASAFHELHLPGVREALESADSVVVTLPPAGPAHSGWRRAAVQGLARSGVPTRINFLAGGDAQAVDHALDWIARAPGVTGQLFQLD